MSLQRLNTVIEQVAATPFDGLDPSADASQPHEVSKSTTLGVRKASADAPAGPMMGEQIRQLPRQWQPVDVDGSFMPCLAQLDCGTLRLARWSFVRSAPESAELRPPKMTRSTGIRLVL